MNALVYLIPISLLLGMTGLAAFLWSVRSNQYEDLDGAAARVIEDDDDKPLPQPDGRKNESERSTVVIGRRNSAPEPDW